jgi:hypothetical protein
MMIRKAPDQGQQHASFHPTAELNGNQSLVSRSFLNHFWIRIRQRRL